MRSMREEGVQLKNCKVTVLESPCQPQLRLDLCAARVVDRVEELWPSLIQHQPCCSTKNRKACLKTDTKGL